MKETIKSGFRKFIWRLFALILNILIVYVIVMFMIQGILPVINMNCFIGAEADNFNFYNAFFVGPMMAVDTMLLYFTYKFCYKFCKWSWYKIEGLFLKIYQKLDDNKKAKGDKVYSANDNITVIK